MAATDTKPVDEDTTEASKDEVPEVRSSFFFHAVSPLQEAKPDAAPEIYNEAVASEPTATVDATASEPSQAEPTQAESMQTSMAE